MADEAEEYVYVPAQHMCGTQMQLRQATHVDIMELLEERLAVGLDSVDVNSVLLLGRCCRRLGASEVLADEEGALPDREAGVMERSHVHGEANVNTRTLQSEKEGQPEKHGHSLRPMQASELMPPEVLPTAVACMDGGRVVPNPLEYARVEAWRWANSWDHGRGTIFRMAPFGARAESIVMPTFCALREPETHAYVQEPNTSARLPTSWLVDGLTAMGTKPYAKRLKYMDMMDVALSTPAIQVVVPAASLVFDSDPAAGAFSRRAARRNPLFIDAVEMGARLLLSMVPPADTPTGDFDREEAEQLYAAGVQLFKPLRLRMRLCVRQIGGPPLDPARLSGVDLEAACRYLTMGWFNALCGSPSTWKRLSVGVSSCLALERSLGPAPGRGRFWSLPPGEQVAAETDLRCGYCGSRPVIGKEVISDTETMLVCQGCSSFVECAPTHDVAEKLAKDLHRSLEAVLGTGDHGLDTCLLQAAPPAGAASAEHAAAGCWRHGEASSVPHGALILGLAGVIEIKKLQHLDAEGSKLGAVIQQELLEIAGCSEWQLRVVSGPWKEDSGSVAFGIALRNPLLFSETELDGSWEEEPDEDPLHLYKRLVSFFVAASSDPTQTLLRRGGTVLRPCSLVICLAKTLNLIAEDPLVDTKLARKSCVAQTLRALRPNIALRLRELVSDGSEDGCRKLLMRWAGDRIVAAHAIACRDPIYFNGQSALDLGIALGNPLILNVLLEYLPVLSRQSYSPQRKANQRRSDTFMQSARQQHSPRRASAGTLVLNRQGSRRISADAMRSTKSERDTLSEKDTMKGLESMIRLRIEDEVLPSLNGVNPVTGYTPIYAIVLYPNAHAPKVVERLVACRADPRLPGYAGGEAPLLAAVKRGASMLVRTMLDIRADVNAMHTSGQSTLHVAVKRGDRRVLREMIATPGIDIEILDSRGRTPLFLAIETKAVDLVRVLLQCTCNVCARDRHGAEPILCAADLQDAETCRLLLENRADCNTVDPVSSKHILFLGLLARNVPLLLTLLEARAEPDVQSKVDRRAPLHFAVSGRLPLVTAKLLELGADVNLQDGIGDTALRLAVQSQDVDTISLLCDARADVNRANRSGCAPIHSAVGKGDVTLVRLLVERAADVNLAESRRWRPVHFAVAGGMEEVLVLLLEARADACARSFHGVTPKDLALVDAPAPAIRAPGDAVLVQPPSCTPSTTGGLRSTLGIGPPVRTPIRVTPRNGVRLAKISKPIEAEAPVTAGPSPRTPRVSAPPGTAGTWTQLAQTPQTPRAAQTPQMAQTPQLAQTPQMSR